MNHRLYYCPILEMRKMKPRGVQVTFVRRDRAGTPTQALLEHSAEEETKERERLTNCSQRRFPLFVCPGSEQFPARRERAGHTAGGLCPEHSPHSENPRLLVIFTRRKLLNRTGHSICWARQGSVHVVCFPSFKMVIISS